MAAASLPARACAALCASVQDQRHERPSFAVAREARALSGGVTLISDPRVVGIPIAECGEPLVDLRDGASGEGLQLDARKQDEAGIWLNVREESGGACFTP